MNLGQFWDELATDLVGEFHAYRSRLKDISISVKADTTLLTDADVAIENMIIDRIREIDPDPIVVAEEDERKALRREVREAPERIWVVDPIDGTAEFVKPDGREFCSVVCLLENLIPVAALILAPELGKGSAPLLVTATPDDPAIMVNGLDARRHTDGSGGRWVSVTRSASEPARPFEPGLEQLGYTLKTRTTSQTLDMLRTAADISEFTNPSLPQFELFMRKNQKVWDGLAGLCLGRKAGLASCDAHGNDRLPVSVDTLSQPEPVFSATIMGDEELVSWLLSKI